MEAIARGARDDRADPINPQRVFWELSPRLPDDCILAADSGSAANWFARDLKIRRGHDGLALGRRWRRWGRACRTRSRAKFAYPDRPVIALVGDGAMQMNGINELITIAQVLEASGPTRGLIVLVLNNRDLNQVTWEQRAMAGDPKFEASQDLPDFPYARYAELARARRASASISPEQVGPAWDEALAADRPVVLEAITDPERAAAAAAHHARAGEGVQLGAARRRPERGRIVRQSFKQKVQEFLPGR